MTINSQAITGNNNIPILNPYTGTAEQPDVVSVFIKWGKKPREITIANEQLVNDLGHYPANRSTALPRIEKAKEILFRERKEGTCSTENSEFWNALSNFIRGIIQLIPFLGNGMLFSYDLGMTRVIHSRLEQALRNQEGPVAGIAFDGKPIFTLPVSELQYIHPSSAEIKEEGPIASVHSLWLSLRQRAIQNHENVTTLELTEEFRHLLTHRPASHSTTT